MVYRALAFSLLVNVYLHLACNFWEREVYRLRELLKKHEER